VPHPVRHPNDTRQRLYEVLRDAMPVAVKVTDLWGKHKILNAHAHAESLRFEGHAITMVQVGEAKTWAMRLDHDAWAGTLDELITETEEPALV
jgi:hypothetical protein